VAVYLKWRNEKPDWPSLFQCTFYITTWRHDELQYKQIHFSTRYSVLQYQLGFTPPIVFDDSSHDPPDMIEPHIFWYVRLDRVGDGSLDRPLQFVQIMCMDMIHVWAVRQLVIMSKRKGTYGFMSVMCHC